MELPKDVQHRLLQMMKYKIAEQLAAGAGIFPDQFHVFVVCDVDGDGCEYVYLAKQDGQAMRVRLDFLTEDEATTEFARFESIPNDLSALQE